MNDDKPWEWTQQDFEEEIKRADDWWKSATPADRFKLWYEIAKIHEDEIVENMSQLAEHMFATMVRRHPTLPIGDPV